MEVVTTTEQVVANLHLFDSYRTSSPEAAAWFSNRLRLGNKFVAGRIGGRLAFAPSRVAGYADCTRERHTLFARKDGRVTNRALTRLLGKPVGSAGLEAAYMELCDAVGAKPASRHARAFWPLADNLTPTPVVRYSSSEFASEVREFVEGATRRVIVNAYERDSRAREACIREYGCNCAVCRFDFRDTYGAIGSGFIHVHHLKPISKTAGRRAIDPITDLRPVCPNCHAMLHRSDPPLTIDELRALLLAED